MLNFTVGPVQSSDTVRKVASKQVPYFRTKEFSEIMFENENYIKELSGASDDSKVVFITGSGTASMEAAVINTLTGNDKVLIINGGGFGQRFVDICNLHGIPNDQIKLEIGTNITEEVLNSYDGNNYSAFIVNLHETSTCTLYDMELIAKYCEKYNLFLIVDAISCFLADPINMKASNINVLITGSQKALSCDPGISVIVVDEVAQNRINNTKCISYYLDLKSALSNAERGQTPFTPAVNILLQINARLNEINNNGGVNYEINKVKRLSNYFRERIVNYGFGFLSNNMSNAATAIICPKNNAVEIFETLKDNYKIWVCPNGGELKNSVLRVGHIGELSIDDYNNLFNALEDMKNKNML